MPGTGVWLADEDPAQMPPHLAELRARWHAGRLQAAATPGPRSAALRVTAHG